MISATNNRIAVVGGVYHESCMQPGWNQVYGSAGRAAVAIARMGAVTTLHSYMDNSSFEAMNNLAHLEGFSISRTCLDQGVKFVYHHSLETPVIKQITGPHRSIEVTDERIIRFGMIEGDAVIRANYAVYDPQNVATAAHFHENGSTANHLALVLNRHEAALLSGLSNADEITMARILTQSEKAEVVVIKMGPCGALVYCGGFAEMVPAFETNRVWKIGSGDTFVAHFGYHWMDQGLPPVEAARLASLATAYYCDKQDLPTPNRLQQFAPDPIRVSDRFINGPKATVYLAGPFFTLAQLWLVEQARGNLQDMGFRVFSPFHDVGHGCHEDVVHQDLLGIDQSDILFAIGDGLDAGTIFEIGYARAKKIPVVMYAENGSSQDQKMMQGSGCIMCADYATAIYKTLWVAAAL